MDPQNSWPDCILCWDLKVLLQQSLNLYCRPLLQHAVVCRDLLPVILLGLSRHKVSLVAIVFFYSTYSFCRVSFVTIDLSLAL